MPLNINTKAKILDIAATLFYQQGVIQTGLDDIAHSVGITKASLYYHFSSKEDLLEQAMLHLSTLCRGDYMKAWESLPDASEERLRVLFTLIQVSRDLGKFYGCPFLNAAIEMRNHDNGIAKIIQNHYAFVINQLTRYAADAELREPDALAKKLATLLLATYANVAVTGASDAVEQTLSIADSLIATHRKLVMH